VQVEGLHLFGKHSNFLFFCRTQLLKLGKLELGLQFTFNQRT